jgi:predicted house-cleaning noncanonical NTP pyrophosphatase (MazG superfamily)
MKKVVYCKLVRDGIPAHLSNLGITSETSVIPPNEILGHLRTKLVEEAREVERSKASKLTQELADVLAVMEAIAEKAGIQWSTIITEKEHIEKEKGAFNNGVFLISTTKPDKPTK